MLSWSSTAPDRTVNRRSTYRRTSPSPRVRPTVLNSTRSSESGSICARHLSASASSATGKPLSSLAATAGTAPPKIQAASNPSATISALKRSFHELVGGDIYWSGHRAKELGSSPGSLSVVRMADPDLPDRELIEPFGETIPLIFRKMEILLSPAQQNILPGQRPLVRDKI